jgi:pimeloyl-ACP methyl ester carboxylesterase
MLAQKLPDARLVVVPGAGHWFLLSRKRAMATAAHVLEFLEGGQRSEDALVCT